MLNVVKTRSLRGLFCVKVQYISSDIMGNCGTWLSAQLTIAAALISEFESLAEKKTVRRLLSLISVESL